MSSNPLNGFIKVSSLKVWEEHLKNGLMGKQSGNLENAYSINPHSLMFRHTTRTHKEIMEYFPRDRDDYTYYVKSANLSTIYEGR